MIKMNWTAANSRVRMQHQGASPAIEAERPPPGRKTAATRATGPKLAEPLTIDSFWINRAHDALVLTASTWKGHNLIDVRKHTMNAAGKLVPTPKGISLKITRLPDLAKAIDKALRKAHELGLLSQDDEATP
jgi:hypothetical protein